MPDCAAQLTPDLSARVIRRFAAAFLPVLFASSALGAPSSTHGIVVFGSYLNPGAAEREAETIGRDLGVELAVAAARVDAATFHRVVSRSLPEAAARQLIARAAERGQDAWFAAGEGSTAAVVVTEPITVPESPADPADPTSTAAAEPGSPARRPGEQAAPGGDVVAPAAPTITDDSAPVIAGTRMDDPNIVIDGRVDEPAWGQAPAYDNMRVMEPETLAEPTYTTASRFIYTADGLYVSAVMSQPPGTLVTRLSSRDQYINRDSYGITLDTSGEGLYGYWFTVALGGSLADGKVAAERSFSREWDGPWRGASAVTDDGWSVEMYLPWSMMSMPTNVGERTLGFWVDRKVAHMDERYSWPVLPFTSPRFMSALKPMGVADVSPAKQWAVFPYTSGTADGIHEENKAKAGVDVLWRPSTNTQVTAAVNPDFGAVESDDVVVNLTAFETYFPEKRLFFLEGSETFITSPRANPQSSQSGPQGQGARRSPQTFFREPTTLLNTRRIGGKARHVEIPEDDDIDIPGVEQSKPTDLLGAAKVVGQAGKVRYGVLGAFEDEVVWRGTRNGEDAVLREDGRNFGAVRMLYEDSTADGRRGIGFMSTMVDKAYETAVVHGIDTHWLGANGKVEWDTQLIASEVGDKRGEGVYMDLNYTPRIGSFHRFALEYLDKDLDVSDFGFIRRTDSISALWGTFQYITGPRLPRGIRNIRTSLFASYEQNTDGLRTRSGAFGGIGFTFSDNSQLRLMLNYFPNRWDDLNSRGNGAFRVTDRFFAQAQYGTDSAKPFALSVALGIDGEDFGGTTPLFDTGFTYTPFHRFTVDFDLRYKDRDGWLVYLGDREFTTYRAADVQPRVAIDLFLTARQQLRMTTQWAGIRAEQQEFFTIPEGGGKLVARDAPVDNEDFAISRLTAQLRYRWEIGPLSDLFVVYTRGANLPDPDYEGFEDLFIDAFREPVVDVFVVKLRYRFGS